LNTGIQQKDINNIHPITEEIKDSSFIGQATSLEGHTHTYNASNASNASNELELYNIEYSDKIIEFNQD
jgi:hypothetical protein